MPSVVGFSDEYNDASQRVWEEISSKMLTIFSNH
jgi:hypothetical protein